MKKDNLASSQQQETKCAMAVPGHEHLHAANCGHRSYVHAGHICYEHEGHFHFMHDGHAHDCPGPKVQPAIPRTAGTSVPVMSKPATVHKLPSAAKTATKKGSKK